MRVTSHIMSHVTQDTRVYREWVMSHIMSHVTGSESLHISWVMSYNISHVTYNESCHIQWDMTHIMSHVTYIMSHVMQDAQVSRGQQKLVETYVQSTPLTHSHVWHVSFLRVTWLIQMCDIGRTFNLPPWLTPMRDMPHFYVWHHSFKCVT